MYELVDVVIGRLACRTELSVKTVADDLDRRGRLWLRLRLRRVGLCTGTLGLL
jgi:hypothetical protein